MMDSRLKWEVGEQGRAFSDFGLVSHAACHDREDPRQHSSGGCTEYPIFVLNLWQC